MNSSTGMVPNLLKVQANFRGYIPTGSIFFEFFPRPCLNRWKTGKHTARYKEQRPLPSMIMAKTTKAATMRFTGTVPDGE